MLMGFQLLDFLLQTNVEKLVVFGRLMIWEEDHNHLATIVVKS